MTVTNTDGHEPPPARMSWDDADPAPVVDWTVRPPGVSGGPVPGAPGFVFANTVARLVAFALDCLLIVVAAVVLAAIVSTVLSLDLRRDVSTVNGLAYGLAIALSAVYFVGSWASRRRATPGMRAFALQVGSGPEGTPLTPVAGLVRWAVMGFPLALLLLVPALAGVAALVSLVVPLVLVVSTRLSPARRGIHDRVAGSVVVQPESQGMTGVLACLVVVVLVLVVSVLAIAALIFLGGQIEQVRRGA